MAYLFVGDRFVDVFFETPSKVVLEVETNDNELFTCTVEHTAGTVTAENLAEAAQGVVRDAVRHEQTAIDQQRAIEDAQRILGIVPEAPRKKFLGVI